MPGIRPTTAIWGRLLRLAGPPGAWQRLPLLACYVIFLVAIILTVVPVSLGLQALLRPFLRQRLAARARLADDRDLLLALAPYENCPSPLPKAAADYDAADEIGRASCRERVSSPV